MIPQSTNQPKSVPTRNLIAFFRTYYKLDIHQFIGNSGHAVMTGLLYKFNELGFPDTLKISVKEMFSLSGISDIRTLRNARNKLIAYQYEDNNPDTWIVKYEDNAIKEYGIYGINYVFLLEKYRSFPKPVEDSSNTPVKLQEDSSKKNGLSTKIASDVLGKSEKNALLSNRILDNTILEKNKICDDGNNDYLSNDIIEFSPEQLTIISLLNQKYCTTFDGGMGTKYFQYIKELVSLPIDTVVEAIEMSMIAKKEETLPKILPYIVAVAKNVEESSQPKEEKKVVSEEKKLLDAKNKFYTQIKIFKIDEFITTGENDSFPEGMISTLKLMEKDLDDNVQLYHFVKQRNPEYLDALENMKVYMEKQIEQRQGAK